MKEEHHRLEWTILIAIATRNKPISEINLKLIVYQFQLITKKLNFQYEPSPSGPYSDEVQAMIEHLGKLEYILKTESGLVISDAGKDRIDIMQILAYPFTVILDLKEFFGELTEDEALLMTYSNHPDKIIMTERLEQILADKLNHALRLNIRGLISTGKAAEIAGLGFRDYQDEFIKVVRRPNNA